MQICFAQKMSAAGEEAEGGVFFKIVAPVFILHGVIKPMKEGFELTISSSLGINVSCAGDREYGEGERESSEKLMTKENLPFFAPKIWQRANDFWRRLSLHGNFRATTTVWLLGI